MKEKFAYGILISACVVGLLCNLYVISMDKTYLYDDSANYYQTSARFYNILTNNYGQSFTQRFDAFLQIYFYKSAMLKPPMLELLSQPFFLIFGFSCDTARISNFVFLLILVISIYLFGKDISNQKVGLLCGALILFIPSIISASREYTPFIAMSSFIISTIFLFRKSDFFSKKFYSLLCGISFGLGMMTRYEFFIYIMPWIILEIYPKFKSIIKNSRRIHNIILFISVSLIVFLPWYIINLSNIVNYILIIAFQGYGFVGNDYLFYIKEIPLFYFGTLVAPLFFIFFAHFIFFVKAKYKLPLLASSFIPLTVFSIIVKTKGSQYFLAGIPLLLIIIVISISEIKINKLSYISFSILTFLILFQFGYSLLLNSEIFVKTFNNHLYMTTYNKKEFNYDLLFNYLKSEPYINNKTLLITSNFPFDYLISLCILDNVSIHFNVPFSLLNGHFIDFIDYENEIRSADYVITLSDYYDNNKEMENEFKKKFEEHINQYDLVLSNYSDYLSANYYLYKRKD